MMFKFKHIRMSFILVLTLFISSFIYVQTTQGSCEVIEVDKKYPLYQTQFKASEVQYLIKEQRKLHNVEITKAKGIVGELLARQVIEEREVKSLAGYVSITTMFENQGCSIQKTLRSNADQGIDDIFVVLRQMDGLINAISLFSTRQSMTAVAI